MRRITEPIEPEVRKKPAKSAGRQPSHAFERSPLGGRTTADVMRAPVHVPGRHSLAPCRWGEPVTEISVRVFSLHGQHVAVPRRTHGDPDESAFVPASRGDVYRSRLL